MHEPTINTADYLFRIDMTSKMSNATFEDTCSELSAILEDVPQAGICRIDKDNKCTLVYGTEIGMTYAKPILEDASYIFKKIEISKLSVALVNLNFSAESMKDIKPLPVFRIRGAKAYLDGTTIWGRYARYMFPRVMSLNPVITVTEWSIELSLPKRQYAEMISLLYLSNNRVLLSGELELIPNYVP